MFTIIIVIIIIIIKKKIGQSRAPKPRGTDVPYLVTTSAVHPTYWDRDSFNLTAAVKDPVVRVRVRWIMEALKDPACAL